MDWLIQLGLSEQSLWLIGGSLVMMALDILTGFAGAVKNGDVSSTKMREGLFHKGGMVVCIVVAWILECLVLFVPELGISVPLLVPACIVVILTEVASIMENVLVLNPSLADSKLLKIFTGLDKDE